MIFVTEDFQRQNKLSWIARNGYKDAVKILKLNMSRVQDGIYPYHLMSSGIYDCRKTKTIKNVIDTGMCGYTFCNSAEETYKVNGIRILRKK